MVLHKILSEPKAGGLWLVWPEFSRHKEQHGGDQVFPICIALEHRLLNSENMHGKAVVIQLIVIKEQPERGCHQKKHSNAVQSRAKNDEERHDHDEEGCQRTIK